MQIGVEFMGNIPRSLVGSHHFTLTKVKPNAWNGFLSTAF